MAGPHYPSHILEHRDLGKRLRSTPAVEGHAQRLAHAHVVEGLARDVEHDDQVLTQVPSKTLKLSFILSSSCAFSEGLRPRNSASNCPPRMPGTTPLDLTKNTL